METKTPKVRDLNACEIGSFVNRQASLLRGARLKKVQEAILGGLMFHTDRAMLYVHIEPGLTHIAVGSRLSGVATPSAFVMLLRKYLAGSRIVGVSMPRAGDRVVEITFSTSHRVVLELTGRHGNVLLLDRDGRILGTWRKSSSTTRPLHPGVSYRLPPPPHGGDQECELVGDGVFGLFQEAIRWRRAEERFREQRRNLKRRLARLRRAVQAVREDIARFEHDLGYKRLGDLLLTVAHGWPEGARSMRLDPAPDGGEPVTLELPTGVSDPIEAAQLAYARYSRAKRGIARARTRLDELNSQLEELQHRLDSLSVESFLEERIDGPRKRAPSAVQRRKRDKRIAGRAFVSADGLPIYVGRNAEENHQLTFRHAHGSHHWFHARDYPGAHVVVFATGDLPHETVLDAATLAIHYSDARTEGEVVHALRKDLAPVKGSPGQVRISKSKILYVVVDQARLRRLLGGSQ